MDEKKQSRIVVSEEDVLKTYPKDLQDIVKQYHTVKKFKKAKKGKGSLTISKKFNIPESRIKNWIYENKKPTPLHTLDFLKTNNLVPLLLNENDERFLFLVRLLSFCFGDGHIEPKNKNIVRFLLYGEKEDLLLIQKELKFYCNVNSLVEKNAKNENGYRLKPTGNGCAAITRLLVVMNAPIGDKIVNPFLLPKWIINSPNKVISHFLGVLFANELTTPKLEKKRSIKAIRFSMDKHEKYVDFSKKFMSQIKELLEKFRIQTTKIRIEKCNIIRKDGISRKISFNIKNNGLNLLNLYKNLYFFYAEKKQEKLEEIINKIKPQFAEQLEIIKKYKIAFYMKRRFGIGRVKISKYLNVNTNTVGGWIYHNKQPLYFSNQNEIKELIK